MKTVIGQLVCIHIAYIFHRKLFKVYSRTGFLEWLTHDEKAWKKALETMKEWRNIVLGSSPTAGLTPPNPSTKVLPDPVWGAIKVFRVKYFTFFPKRELPRYNRLKTISSPLTKFSNVIICLWTFLKTALWYRVSQETHSWVTPQFIRANIVLGEIIGIVSQHHLNKECYS